MAKNLILWLIVALIVMSIFSSLSDGNKTSRQLIDYTIFLEQVDANKVASATITNGNGKINYTLRTGKIYQTVIIGNYDKDLINDLKKHGVKANAIAPEGPGFLSIILGWVPMLLLIGVWIWFMKKQQGGGGAMGFGKSKAKQLGEDDIDTRFGDVAGCEEAKFEVSELVEYMRSPKKFHAVNADIPRGLLMLGPPGTGKTLLARAIAGEAKLPFFTVSGSDFVEMYVGVGASRVRDLFNQAKSCPQGAIIFIDEIDAIGGKRGGRAGAGGHDEREQTLNAILVEMDGFAKDTNVIVIAATNRVDTLDPALLRPGRFTRQVTVGLPDVGGRQKILELHAHCTPLADDVSFKKLAQGTPGMSGADLANLINEAAIFAARDERKAVSMDDLEKAIEKVTMGPERKTAIISDAQKDVTGMHEAGHCLLGYIAHSLGYHSKPSMVTIMPRGQALGVTSFRNEGDANNQNKGELMAFTLTLLAGRIGEWIHHGKNELKISTGASSDLDSASQVVRSMITDCGFSTELGPLTAKSNEYGQPLASPETLSKVDRVAKEWLNAADCIVRQIIQKHEKELRAMTEVLREKETIRDADIEALFGHLVDEYKNVNFEDIFNIEVKATEISRKKEIVSNTVDISLGHRPVSQA